MISFLSRLALVVGPLLVGPSLGVASLTAFNLPWDDASPGVSDSAWLNSAPAGRGGWVQVDAAGNLVDAQGRVRLFGVNIGAAACFPSHADAEKIAARLAKFGVNGVRFHHLDQTWTTPGLIDYSRGNSRSLNATNLDRLHYFMAQLKARGIYVNLNLLVSRRFYAADGLPAAIEDLDWKRQHTVALAEPAMVSLQREYATALLGTVNPYTGLAPAADPAVVCVEIMNENGIIQTWLEGGIDTWPGVFREAFRQRWNTWLAGRHADTAALAAAWGLRTEAFGPDLLVNGGFSSGSQGWTLEQHGGAVASATPGTYAGRSGLRLTVTTPGTADWHVQFNQAGLSLVGEALYTIDYAIRSSDGLPASASVMMAHAPYSGLGFSRWHTPGTDWLTVQESFIASATDTQVRVNFGGFGNRSGSVDLADVRLRRGGSTGAAPAPGTLESGALPLPKRAAPGTPGQQDDWLDFLRASERAYWREMRSHIEDTLGYPGLVFGTILANSPASVAADFPVVDSHAYWQHPIFPGAGWDPVNWQVAPSPMVNDAHAGTLLGIAAQDVLGKAHFVTEYQHSSPNPYGADAALLLAAYAALHDWDGLFLFDYGWDDAGWDSGFPGGFFDQSAHPAKMVNTAVAARLFRRGDLRPASTRAVLAYGPERERDDLRQTWAWGLTDPQHTGLKASTVLAQASSLAVTDPSLGAASYPAASGANVHSADTGELTWDLSQSQAGVVTCASPRSQAVIGFDNGRSFNLGGVVIDPGSTNLGWSTITLSWSEGGLDRIAQGGRILLVATGEQENTGQVWTDATRQSLGSQWGGAPVRIETVAASVTLPVPAGLVRWWVLDGRGQRSGAVRAAASGLGGRARLDLGLGGQTGTLWYEVEVDPMPALQATAAAGNLTVRYTPHPTAALTLESSPDLQTWSPLAATPQGDGSAQASVPLVDGRGFVRWAALP